MMMKEAERILNVRRAALVRLATTHRADEDELLSVREPDWEDTAAEVRDARVLGRLAADERQELEEIDGALARIRAGRWGTCESCQKPIPARRLAARPESARCIRCAS